MLNNVVETARIFMQLAIKEGNFVLDATCGNGYDTEFLSELVGKDGVVYAFDIQKIAIERTAELLQRNNNAGNVNLICDSHEYIAKYVEKLDFAIFNLGYLPNSDKSVITGKKSTVKAVKSAIELLNPGGLIVICSYLGHLGGKEEFDFLVGELSKYDCDAYNITVMKHLIRHDDAPRIILIEKKNG